MERFYPGWNDALFYLINSGLTSDFADLWLVLFRNKLFWIPFYVFITTFLLVRFQRWGVVIMLAFIATVGFSDIISSRIMKPAFATTRPCLDQELEYDVITRAYCSNKGSFPSSHATNHFAMAFFLALYLKPIMRWLVIPLTFWASLICFSQVYVGVHYPLDVVAGAALGAMIGTTMAWLLGRYLPISVIDHRLKIIFEKNRKSWITH